MKDLKLVVKLRHFHNIIRWAYRSDVRKAGRDIGSYVELMAEGGPSDAGTFLSEPVQREMFEASFTTANVWTGAGHAGFVDRERWCEFLAALTARHR